MPKYWGKQIFTHGRFTEVGQKQKTEKKEKKQIFIAFFLLFMTSVRSRPPGLPAVPGVFGMQPHFNPTRRFSKENKSFFIANIWSRPPGPTLPWVIFKVITRVFYFCPVGMCAPTWWRSQAKLAIVSTYFLSLI